MLSYPRSPKTKKPFVLMPRHSPRITDAAKPCGSIGHTVVTCGRLQAAWCKFAFFCTAPPFIHTVQKEKK